MTSHEGELIAALETDIHMWESLVEYVERSVSEIELPNGKKISGGDYTQSVRQRISEHRALIEKVKSG